MKTIVLVFVMIGVSVSLAQSQQTLLVLGIEYTAWPDHYGVSGIGQSLPQYAYQGQPIPPYTERAQDIAGLLREGTNPLTWFAHPNWRREACGVAAQVENLLGVSDATCAFTPDGLPWYPDALAVHSVSLNPTWNGVSDWRRQSGLEMANRYCDSVAVRAPDHVPAFILEGDFHNSPAAWFRPTCIEPVTTVWVPANWRSLSAEDAMAAVFSAVRERRTIGTVGNSRFSSVDLVGSTMTFSLTEPLEHVQLWGGGSESVATWNATATASFDLAALAPGAAYLFWYAYGDTTVGDWNVLSCDRKALCFTSPIVREEPGGPFRNQYDPVALQGSIPIRVLFHQHTSISSDGNPNLTFPALLDDCRALGVDCVLTNDHDPTLRSPLPGFVTTWDALPVAALWDRDAQTHQTPALVALPNPVLARSQITIRYTLTHPAPVRIRLHDATGRTIRTVHDAPAAAGVREASIATGDLASGTYFLLLDAGGRRYSTRVTVTH